MSRLCRARRSLPFCAAFSAGARAAQPRGQITTGWRICAAKLTLCSGLFENHHESQGKRSGKPSIRGTRLTVTMCSQAGHAASVKLLFDQNVSPGLPRLPADLYPGSTHVREVGLRDASDAEIWRFAGSNGFAIVSNDTDFQQQSLLLGQPPKFIWLRVGNCPAERVHEVLRTYAAAIEAFAKNVGESHLMLP